MKNCFATMWGGEGNQEKICSVHKSVIAAITAAGRCERIGGADHRIVEIVEVVPYGKFLEKLVIHKPTRSK